MTVVLVDRDGWSLSWWTSTVVIRVVGRLGPWFGRVDTQVHGPCERTDTGSRLNKWVFGTTAVQMDVSGRRLGVYLGSWFR